MVYNYKNGGASDIECFPYGIMILCFLTPSNFPQVMICLMVEVGSDGGIVSLSGEVVQDRPSLTIKLLTSPNLIAASLRSLLAAR